MQRLTRHFFISDDLNVLEHFEQDLERGGVVTPQIHVLTLEEGSADNHHSLHQVTAFMKRNLIHSTILGAIVGVCVAFVLLLIAYLAGWTRTPAGWLPFAFLSIIALGFFTWEGGLLGIEKPNQRFRNFEAALEKGRHVFFVDLTADQKSVLEDVVKRHPSLEPAGQGRAAPHWIVRGQHRVKHFFTHTFP